MSSTPLQNLSVSTTPHGSELNEEPSPSKARKKITHACDRCRTLRIRCTGGPRCRECMVNDAVCRFSDRMRERKKKEFSFYNDRIAVLERERDQLQNCLTKVSESDNLQPEQRADITELLASLSTDTPDSSRPDSSREALSPSTSQQGSSVRPGEKTSTSEVGSPGGGGQLSRTVNLDTGQGLSGFVGKMSEISWMHRAWQHCNIDSTQINEDPRVHSLAGLEPPENDDIVSAENFTYFVDEENLLSIDEDYIEPNQLPSVEVATILSEAYFLSARSGLLLIDKQDFYQTSSQCLSRRGSPFSRTENRWLLKANVVWALGAKWLQSIGFDQTGRLESHLVYYARSRALGLDHRVPLDHPNVDMIEASGLLALYLLANGSISRAWNTLGQALRHSTALGLHLKIQASNITLRELQRRAEVWHSLCVLEVLLSEVTGRPKSVNLLEVTLPRELLAGPHRPQRDNSGQSRERLKRLLNLVDPADRKVSSTTVAGLSLVVSAVDDDVPQALFQALSRLCEISDEVSRRLYSATTSTTWYEYQESTRKLSQRLAAWRSNLPENLQLPPDQSRGSGSPLTMHLHMQFWSVQMILCRPYLCVIRIPNESEESKQFNRSMARTCIEAAVSVLQILPQAGAAPDLTVLLQWWSLLHYTAQAMTVLLLEFCLNWFHCVPAEVSRLTDGLREALEYLWHVSRRVKSVFRFWGLARLILDVASKRDQVSSFAAVPSQAPPPNGWTYDDQQSFDALLNSLRARQRVAE